MSTEAQLLEYKKRIKEWEKLFHAENGRLPTKNDVKANNDIRKAYKTYNQLKERSKRHSRTNETNKSASAAKSEKPLENKPLNISIDTSDDELSGEESKTLAPMANAEFGPTPQANGKVLSIFDVIMSPPESSPLKLKQSSMVHSSPVKMKQSSEHMFKTPTKAVKKIEFADLTPARGSGGKSSVMAKLRQASSPQKPGTSVEQEWPATPTKSSSGPVIETPFYLGKVNNKFLFRDSDAGTSPVADIFTTPTKASPANTFQVSPSPLKPQRMISFGSTRSVSEIFNDSRNIDFEELEAQKLEIEKELELMEEQNGESEEEREQIPQTRKRKVLTQKRTTRRWKIKPNSFLDKEDAFEGKNIHDEIKKLEENERKKTEEYMNGGDDDITEEKEEEVELIEAATKLKAIAANKKLRPISNNFQRLKINDPRTKKFKQRMRRR